jgi:hypothetical protein
MMNMVLLQLVYVGWAGAGGDSLPFSQYNMLQAPVASGKILAEHTIHLLSLQKS